MTGAVADCACAACVYSALLADLPPAPTHESEPRVIQVMGADQAGGFLTVAGSSPFTANVGDLFVIEGCDAVNPMSYANTGYPRRFVVTQGTVYDHVRHLVRLAIHPPIVPFGPYQNVNASPVNGAQLHLVHPEGLSA